MSIFGRIFGGAKKEEEKVFEVVEEQKEKTKKIKAKKPKQEIDVADKRDFKSVLNEIDRSGPNNMYQRVPKTRLSRKERDQNVHSFLHPDLLNNERVTI